MNTKVFLSMLLWGFLCGMMGYVVTNAKGLIVWFVGTILFMVVTWEKQS